MPNQYVNKVQLGNEVLLDLTADTATAADVAAGKTFHLASGASATGTASGGGGADSIELTNGAKAYPMQGVFSYAKGGTPAMTVITGLEEEPQFIVGYGSVELPGGLVMDPVTMILPLTSTSLTAVRATLIETYSGSDYAYFIPPSTLTTQKSISAWDSKWFAGLVVSDTTTDVECYSIIGTQPSLSSIGIVNSINMSFAAICS